MMTNDEAAPMTKRSPVLQALDADHRRAQDAKREARRRRDREKVNAKLALHRSYGDYRVRF